MQRRRQLVGAWLAVSALLSGCGARTELQLAELCPSAGMTRPCVDVCGTGLESCRGGVWSACEVPVVTRACSDDCGSGLETCASGAWGQCQVPEVQRDCSSACGPGHETCRVGKWRACDAPQPRPPQLRATIRDFSPSTHPDFEAQYPSGLDPGIVAEELGPDDKPAYTRQPRTPSTSGKANFDKWFRDDPVNLSAPLELQLQPASDQPGLFVYDNPAFFPIDGQLLGNEGRSHNFHFTLEANTQFEYRGGEVFSFSGDDDMWVFINYQLAIDLGGIHQSLSAELTLDRIAERFSLMRGQTYRLDFFFAERHTTQSHFTLRTSIAEPGSCD